MLKLEDIEKMTKEYGEEWAYPHICRVRTLVDLISPGIPHDPEALTYAIYLHDWGALPKFVQPGVDHALLSAQIAREQILPQTGLPASTVSVILEAIALHDYRCPDPAPTNESLLLREADFLDFIGAIGIAREIARGPKNLQKCRANVLARRDGVKDRFTIPAARALAEQRLTEMNHFLKLLEAESFGYL